MSRTVGEVMPDLVSWKWQKSERQGRARLDYTQNAINKTLVAPYSTRAGGRGAREHADRVARARRSRAAAGPLDDPDRSGSDREVGDLFRGVLAEGQELPEFS